nr:uncharacterized protein LOC105866367 [Microcebus murinus]
MYGRELRAGRPTVPAWPRRRRGCGLSHTPGTRRGREEGAGALQLGPSAAAAARLRREGAGCGPRRLGVGSLKAAHGVRKCGQSQRLRSRKEGSNGSGFLEEGGHCWLCQSPSAGCAQCASHTGVWRGLLTHWATRFTLERDERYLQGTTREVCPALVKSLRTLDLAPGRLELESMSDSTWSSHAPRTACVRELGGPGTRARAGTRAVPGAPHEGTAHPGQQDLTTLSKKKNQNR